MNIRLWLTGAAGAVAVAAALAFAPVTPTSAQEIAPADTAVVMQGYGQGTMAHDGTCDEATFVDADGDGVCDKAGTNASDSYVDADGDGVCDTMGTATPAGSASQARRGRP